jgi:outer membrane protein assembly factor BamB
MAQGLAYAYGRIYTVTETKCLYVLDEFTGAKLSYYNNFGAQMHSMPSLYNGSLYIGCETGTSTVSVMQNLYPLNLRQHQHYRQIQLLQLHHRPIHQ